MLPDQARIAGMSYLQQRHAVEARTIDAELAWYDEAFAMSIEPRDFGVAEAADLPTELLSHIEAATLDPNFDADYEKWTTWLYEVDIPALLLLVIEQCCSEGLLLPRDQRDTRISNAPIESVALAAKFFAKCPRHVAAYIGHYNYWLVRCERARRRGTPHWTPRMPFNLEPSRDH